MVQLLAAAAAFFAALVGGILLGHYAWESDKAAAPARPAAPNVRSGAPPRRLDPNLRAVLASPRIHNLYWDNHWSSRAAHGGFHRLTINNMTASLVATSYLAPAAQYGVGAATFAGQNLPSGICGALRAPATISAAAVQAWVTCMATTVATGVPLPVPRIPVSNDLYVVYLPSRTTITDNLSIPRFSVGGSSFGPLTLLVKRSCTDYGAYHAFGAAITGLFAYTVIPTRCFSGDVSPIDGISVAASHELVEASTDPLLLAGWIDNSVTIGGFMRLITGEAADICSSSGAVPTAPVRRGGVLVAPYWSNSRGACVTSAAG
jgi:hypothetical protein